MSTLGYLMLISGYLMPTLGYVMPTLVHLMPTLGYLMPTLGYSLHSYRRFLSLLSSFSSIFTDCCLECRICKIEVPLNFFCKDLSEHSYKNHREIFFMMSSV
jgi:hypothetical protein